MTINSNRPAIPDARSRSLRSMQLPDGRLANVDEQGRIIKIEAEEDDRVYYERSFALGSIAGNAPGIQLLNPVNSTVNVALVRIELVLVQAVPSTFALIYGDRKGTGTSADLQPGLDVLTPNGNTASAPSGQARLATTWTTIPTLNANYLRSQFMSTLGETTVWEWDPQGSGGPPLVIPQGASVILREAADVGMGEMLVNMRWQEQRLGQKNVR